MNAYDAFGNRTSMTTYRNEASGIGDTTTWTCDDASGVLLAKTYADGKGLTYTYTDDGRLATRTNARGIVTTYTYDDWGQLLAIDYADDTPDIAYTYDAMGRQTSATDTAGSTTFTYDAFSQLISEQVNGLYTKTLTRHWDAFGRNVGYSVDGVRKRTLTYDTNTGRLSGMDGFAWEYLPGSDLKSKLIYPNGATAKWAYEPKRDLLTQVKNTINGVVASQYDYANDLFGRRTAIGKSGSMMAQDETQAYTYNTRDELVSGQGRTYAYDDIGNRTAAEERGYVANALNQYTAIDDFVPEYDADGNQTKVQTETGVWTVTYNAENRPIRWQSGDTVITMTFDRMGRRVDYQETRAGEVVTHFRFVYDGYLCVQRLDALQNNAVRTEFVWDPTEPVATRPLAMRAKNWDLNLFYSHDGNKNVSEVFYHAPQNGIAAHYDYAPFGAITRTSSATRVTNHDLISENPFRFSSEYHDDPLSLVYYNCRHYTSLIGRWLTRDKLSDFGTVTLCGNNPLLYFDLIGLKQKFVIKQSDINYETFILNQQQFKEIINVFNPTTCPVGASAFLLEFKGGEAIYDSRCKTCEVDVSSLNVSIYTFLLEPGLQENFQTSMHGTIDVYLSESFMQEVKAHEQRHVDVFTAAICSQDFSIDTKFKVNSEEECIEWESTLRRKFASEINKRTTFLHDNIDRESYFITKGPIPMFWFWGYRFEMKK